MLVWHLLTDNERMLDVQHYGHSGATGFDWCLSSDIKVSTKPQKNCYGSESTGWALLERSLSAIWCRLDGQSLSFFHVREAATYVIGLELEPAVQVHLLFALHKQ
jgi:hypothetical protein